MTADLEDAANALELWETRFQGKLETLFAVQEAKLRIFDLWLSSIESDINNFETGLIARLDS